MKRMMYLLTLLFPVFLLTACASDISGTWIYEFGGGDAQMRLEIDKKDVTLYADVVELQSGFLTVEEEERTEVIATGTVEGNKLKLTIEDSDLLPSSFSPGEQHETNYKLSSDKKSLILYMSEEEMVFSSEDSIE